VAWFFLQETTPHRLAEHAAKAILAKVDNAPALAPRTLAREVEDHLEKWTAEAEAVEARAIEAAPEADRDFDAIRAAMREKATEGVCGGSPSPPPPHPTFATGEALDEALAGFLERIGEAGRGLGAEVRQNSKARTPDANAAMWAPGGKPLRVARLLARALWADVVEPLFRENERLATIPAATIHPSVRTALMNAPVGRIRPQKDLSVDFGVEGGRRRGHLPPIALVSVGEQALRIEGDRLRVVIPLAAWLAHQAWERWQKGDARFDWIPLPSGRDALRSHLGGDVKEAELDDALAWLQDLKVGGLPCIDASPPPEDFATEDRHGRGGRPEKRRIVRVGAPLAPMGLESVYRDAKMVLPPELRFFSPVLSPADAPLAGNRRTFSRQRDFYALGLGAFFVEHREEYTERGGVKITPSTWRAHLEGAGIYHRSHQSLADDVWAAYLTPRAPGLFGKRGAVLQETAPGSGVFRLGDDFQEQELVITRAAAKTAAAKKRHRLGRDGAGKRRRQSKADS
jgi:hypothetical protein